VYCVRRICCFVFSPLRGACDNAVSMSGIGTTAVPVRNPRDGFIGSQTRRRSLPHTPRAAEELLAKDRQLADLEVLAAERLAEIKNLQQCAADHTRQIDLVFAERAWLATRVEDLTGEVDRLSSELERIKSAPGQAGLLQSRQTSPLSIHHSFPSRNPSPFSRHASPVRSEVITELKQLLENNQVTAKRLKDELNQISRKSKDEDTAVAGLQNVYKQLSSCCTELEMSLYQSSTDFDRLFSPELVSGQSFQ